MAKRWIIPPAREDCAELAQLWGVPTLIAQLMINRGVETDGDGGGFLSPLLKNLHPPSALPGATLAAERIVEAIREKRKIVLYGDYDVDGTTGVAILWHILTAAGADVSFYVPHRVEEGYGLHLAAIKRLLDDGAQMIVSVDCGITAVEVAQFLHKAGVALIITDHHTPQEHLPQADAIVHPTVGGTYPNPHLCGAGVAFKLAWAIAQRFCGAERVDPVFRELLKELLALAALATIADAVPLVGENRIIAKHGLRGLATSKLPGVQALIDSAGLTGSSISGTDAGFTLAPRINAAGRMGHARLAVELFTRANAERAREIAMYLDGHNRARRSTERKISKQARAMVEDGNLAGDARRAIVLASDAWHAGVIGIVASRLVERYQRPTVLIALSNGEGQGSARSIEHFNLADALCVCGEHLISYGGHAMAAGLRIDAARVDAFTEAFVAHANQTLTGEDLIPKLRLDAEVTLDALTIPTTEAIVGLGPFGLGNPKPTLSTAWVELAAEPRCVGSNGEHLQASFLQNGVRMKGIGFGMASGIEDLKHHRRCRVAFEPMINEFRGRRSVEMRLIDLQFPT